MSAFLAALEAMAMLAIIIVVGYILRKVKWTNDKFDTTLSKLTIQVACPALIIGSILTCTELPSMQIALQILGVSALAWVPMLLVAFVLPYIYRVPKCSRGVHQFTLAFGNTGLIGFAVLNTMLGNDAVLYASIFNIPYNVAMFSVGMIMMSSSGEKEVSRKEKLRDLRRNLISPVMIACVVALLLLVLRITDANGIIGQASYLLGQMTAPAAMLITGSSIAKFKVRDMVNDWRAYLTMLGRLLLMPVIMYFVASIFALDSFVVAVLVLVVAMPVASVGTMMCLLYNGDLKAISRCTFLTTILSIASIPLVSVFVL